MSIDAWGKRTMLRDSVRKWVLGRGYRIIRRVVRYRGRKGIANRNPDFYYYCLTGPLGTVQRTWKGVHRVRLDEKVAAGYFQFHQDNDGQGQLGELVLTEKGHRWVRREEKS